VPIRMANLKKYIPITVGAAFTAGVLTYLYASRIEARRFRLERMAVQLSPKGSTTGNGGRHHFLRILHISDLHLLEQDLHKAEFLDNITDDDYDLVVLTGDIFQNEGGFVHWQSLLRRKPRLGAFAVLGNHDYFVYDWYQKTIGRLTKSSRSRPKERRDVSAWIKHLEQAGYRVLQNEVVNLNEVGISILGVDYPTIERDLLNGLVARVPRNQLLFALFHLPYKLKMLCEAGVKLGFGGHTHGGQVRIPGIGAVFTDSELAKHEASGLIWRGDTAFHISRGLGADPRTNFRLFCPPHATILEVQV